MWIGLIILGVVVVIAIWLVAVYNGLIKLKNSGCTKAGAI